MEIHNIQKYNATQTFTALRLKKGSQSFINSMPKQMSDKLDEISKSLENTTYYHLDIGKDSYYICHKDGERFYLPVTIANAGKAVIIKAKQGLSQISFKLKYKTTAEAKDVIEKTRAAKTQLERTSEIVKILDNYEKEYK